MSSLRRLNYTRGTLDKISKKCSRKSLTVPKMSHSPRSLSLYIAEHTRFVPKIKKLSLANRNRARKKPSNFVNQSESSITSPKSSASQNGVLRHPRALGLGGGPVSALGSSGLAIAYINT